nr:MAG TPA: hypothetical protein [Caudoviricetes sp.]
MVTATSCRSQQATHLHFELLTFLVGLDDLHHMGAW